MRIIAWLLLAVALLATARAKAQNTGTSLFLEESLEELSMEDDTQDWSDELEELSHRLQQPVNLNIATRSQLEQFPFLSDIQIENLLAYIYLHGAMKSVYELQMVGEWDKRTIELLLPFVCVHDLKEKDDYPSLKRILRYGKHELLTRLDVPFYKRKGYETAYLGPAMYHSLRYSFRYSDYLQLGITAEKDAGEPLFALHCNKGYDYYSPYLLIKNMGWLKTLAIGNYRLDFGQGLVLNSAFRLGKFYSLSTSEYRNNGIRKYSSTDEYNYFRGVAATVQLLSDVQFSAFYSHRSLDGVIEDGAITSVYKTGLHRSKKEAAKKDAFALQLLGGNVTYEKNRLKVGATAIYYFFNRPYEPTLAKYAKYNLHGQEFYNVSIDYKYRIGRFSWTGEAAKGIRGYATLNRLKYTFSPDYSLMLLHRYYAHDYWSLFARSFSEGTALQNENGWYIAAEASPFARWRFFASLDMFAFPWWKYRISKPSQGVDAMFQATYSPHRSLSMYLRYRYKRKERDVTGTSGEETWPTHHHRLRYRLDYSSGCWSLRTTADYNRFHSFVKASKLSSEATQGYQCTQALGYTFSRLPLSVGVQGTYFHTDDYDSRVYVYEKSLLYAFSIPSFYGCGFRCSAHVRCDFNRHLMLLVKLGQTLYQDRDEISSGNDLIRSNRKMDLQMQLRVKL